MSKDSLEREITSFLNVKASKLLESKLSQNELLSDDFEIKLVEKYKPVFIHSKINLGAKFLLEINKVEEIIDISTKKFIELHKIKRKEIETENIKKKIIEIEELSYLQLLSDVVNSYKTEFGERKFKKVLNEVLNSIKIKKMFIEFEKLNKPINPKDVLYCLNTIPYFIFSRGQTLTLGAILTIQLWNEKVNHEYWLLKPIELKDRIEFILRENNSINF